MSYSRLKSSLDRYGLQDPSFFEKPDDLFGSKSNKDSVFDPEKTFNNFIEDLHRIYTETQDPEENIHDVILDVETNRDPQRTPVNLTIIKIKLLFFILYYELRFMLKRNY